jgi:hypothetical protein
VGLGPGAIAPGSAKLTRKPRDRPGSRITSQRLEAARRWMHRRENPLCDLEGPRAGCSRDSASVHAESERSRAKARPFSLRVSPTAALPQGSLHRRGGGTRADAHAQGAESPSVQKDLRTQGVSGSASSELVSGLQLDIEQFVVLGWDTLSDLSMSCGIGSRATSDRKPWSL